MTDEEIKALAEKTKKEKYCKLYCEKPNLCSDLCPICDIVDCLHCEDTIYKMAFLDGFKAGYKKGQDSMSDYVIELQHAAYND